MKLTHLTFEKEEKLFSYAARFENVEIKPFDDKFGLNQNTELKSDNAISEDDVLQLLSQVRNDCLEEILRIKNIIAFNPLIHLNPLKQHSYRFHFIMFMNSRLSRCGNSLLCVHALTGNCACG